MEMIIYNTNYAKIFLLNNCTLMMENYEKILSQLQV